jgi:acetyl-CoA carboxylase biotin carboxylase subunit
MQRFIFDVMFKKILIANRGEIAVRIWKAAKELGIKVVACASEPDRQALHVRLADEVYILSGEPTKVYLDGPQIIEAAKRAGAEAIHPGYGFLAENADFARQCGEAGIVFIGPQPDVIAAMGSKVEARRLMSKAGVPVVPGTIDPVTEVSAVQELGSKFGYPIAIKAAAGGGGRGLRVVRSADEVEKALAGAQREGLNYFGSNEVYVEKYLERPHHVEVQIIGDNQGNVVHLFERDCSAQRRHQKLTEESPAPKLSQTVRAKLLDAACKAASALKYRSAGTIECLVWGEEFYFLEVNTRVQVEHPITEMVTGIDIVKEQIRIAAGLPLSFKQADVVARGVAIECRINAEDPFKSFMPQPGKVTKFSVPNIPWVRVDSACYDGYEILPFYDSLIAKLVVWGRDRDEAIARTEFALKNLVIDGVQTTIPFHVWLLQQEAFKNGDVDTTWVEAHAKDMVAEKDAINASLGVKADLTAKPDSANSDAPQITRLAERQFEVTVNQRVFTVGVSELADSARIESVKPITKTKSQPTPARALARPESVKPETNGHSGNVKSEMHGLVKEILVKPGENVKVGQRLLILEAMKMESEILAKREGKIASINVKAGETVEAKALLLVISD